MLIEVDWEKDAKPVEEADRALFQSRASAGFDGKVAPGKLRSRFT